MAHSQTIDFVRAVKLRGTRSGAAPPANCRSHNRSAGCVHGDHQRAENSRYARRRSRKRQWIPQELPLQPGPLSAQDSAVLGFEPVTGLTVATIVAVPPAGTLDGAESCNENYW